MPGLRPPHRRPAPRAAAGCSGFTLIEMMVVVLIMSILMAVAVPAFMGQRARAQDGEAKMAVHTMETALGVWATDNGGSYAGATLADLVALEPVLGQTEPTLSVVAAGATTYTVRAVSRSGTAFVAELQGSGSFDRRCSPAGAGGCRADGSW